MNDQTTFWKTGFGDNYIQRNNGSVDEVYLKKYGITRTSLNQEFLSDIPKNSKILEVGCNIGLQLKTLKNAGFTNLYGIEINNKALDIVKENKDFNVIYGDAFNIPFKDNFFDLVFTSDVLIHISPDKVSNVFKEMIRVSNKFLLGFEYYSDNNQEINYRGHTGVLWKDDFSKKILEQNSELELIKEKKIKYLNGNNFDVMYLISKKIK